MRGSPLEGLGKPTIGHLPPPVLRAVGEESQSSTAKSASRYPKPNVLMGEVIGPKGQMIGVGREALRAFMMRARLTPSGWARAAGVAPGEILAFLSGRTAHIAPDTLTKLAQAANTNVAALVDPQNPDLR